MTEPIQEVTEGPEPPSGQQPETLRRFVPRMRRSSRLNPHHTRFVGMMRVFLPALAIALVVIVLAWPGAFDHGRTLELAFSLLQRGDAEALTMVSPKFSGTDSKNRPFTITAASATQDPDDQRRVKLETLQADLGLSDGTWLSLLARDGIYQQTHQTLKLRGGVDLYSDRGYELHAEELDIDLGAGSAVSKAPVKGQGPFGRVTADAMRIEENGARIILAPNVSVTVRPGVKG